MTKIRKNITQNPVIVALAEAIMAERHFDDYSSFLEQLIREEGDRRQIQVKPEVLHDKPAATTAPSPASKPVKYSEGARVKGARFRVHPADKESGSAAS
jgi:hypothetical protein